jgi:hypothetical protein
MRFHSVHSRNIGISADERRARRIESFCKGICFGSRPVGLMEKVYIKFAETSTSWSGVLRFGYSAHDPDTINGTTLPRYACPDLTNKPGYWAKALGERYAETGNVVYFYRLRNGDVMFGVNDEEKGLFLTCVNPSLPLWPLVDVYGNTVAMEFVGKLILLLWCLLVIYTVAMEFVCYCCYGVCLQVYTIAMEFFGKLIHWVAYNILHSLEVSINQKMFHDFAWIYANGRS